MTQHAELIDQLRDIGLSHAVQAADALESQALEIQRLRAELERSKTMAGIIHEGLRTMKDVEP